MPTFYIETNGHKITSCQEVEDDENAMHTIISVDDKGVGSLKIPAQNEERARYYASMHLYIHDKGVTAEKVAVIQ